MSNIDLLSKIPLITEIEELHFSTDITKDLNEKQSKIIQTRSESIFVYKFFYTSQGHKVMGYIAEPREGSLLPCIIYNRGGSGEFGRIEDEHLFSRQIGRLADAGYICITTQYSGSAGGEGVDEMGGSDIEDVLVLYKILKKYPRADIKRIGMYGASRGGMMAYIILSKVKWLKAVVTLAALVDLVDKEGFRPKMHDHYVSMFGASLKEKKKRSAVYWVDSFPRKTPILMMHGTADWRVNPLYALRMAEKLLHYKIPYRLIMYEGGDHGLREFSKESSDETIRWFDRFVKTSESLPNLKPHGD